MIYRYIFCNFKKLIKFVIWRDSSFFEGEVVKWMVKSRGFGSDELKLVYSGYKV